jgi:hypothetical protein
MRYLLTVMLTLCVVSLAGAHMSTFSNVAPDKETFIDEGGYDGREGGETFADAVPIPSLPYSDTGGTCDNINDYALSCVYDGGAPDVVYSYTAASAGFVTVSLCGSSYDTALGIFDAGYVEIYCNDDFCGLQSEIEFAAAAGATYYIVVDGYGSSCGDYLINVTSSGSDLCDPSCPDGGMPEGEPDCYDGYYDATNGGCNSEGWTLVCPDEGTNTQQMCGTSGTYIYEGLNYRDTDWMQVYGDGGTMTATCCASFPLQFILIYGNPPDCNNLQYDLITANPFEEVSLSRTAGAGEELWVWVGASVFSGVPCGSEYLLTMEGIWCQTTATEETTIGKIKSLYR